MSNGKIRLHECQTAPLCYNPDMTQYGSRVIQSILLLGIIALSIGNSTPPITNQLEKVRAHTRQVEFNYLSWMANATLLKIRTSSIEVPQSFNQAAQEKIVQEYLQCLQEVFDKESEIEQIYADASVIDKQLESKSLRIELAQLTERQKNLAPFAEAIIQEQVSQVLAELGLTIAGQPFPAVWYHSTPLPMALIASPRDHIEQIANVSIAPELAVDQISALEDQVTNNFNLSSLVVKIGGVGVYPTMVMRTTDLNWLLSTVAHEWIHNYLTLRPLGILYEKNPQLRTMNETTASIAGDEIGGIVFRRFYPELAKNSLNAPDRLVSHPEPGSFLRPPFDFRAEMHETRVRVDELLAKDEVEEAESYMEMRRLLFLKNGYLIRKLNQAYFSFYGAYADTVGAAGEDPVGPTVRALRAQSKSLSSFINKISWMTDFEQLKEAVSR